MKTKELVSELHELVIKAAAGIDAMQEAFLYNSLKPLERAQAASSELARAEKALTEALVAAAREDSRAAMYVSVPGILRNIGSGIERIIVPLTVKIKEGVLFSDKAVSELNFLFERVRDILTNTGDVILARNTVLAGYVRESEAQIVKSANDFATFHEERLIEGICMPRASSLFIGILDAIKGIAWNAREIAERLAGNKS